MLRAFRLFCCIGAALVLFDCSSSGGGGSAGRGGTGNRNSSSGLPPVEERKPEPSRGDRRIILLQSKVSTPFILVNQGHSGLATQQGQLAIALGSGDQAYKVIGETTMENLFESLRNFGLDTVATPFERGDEAYFGGHSAEGERYRGLIYVEDNGVRRKILGLRPRGPEDLDGQKKYKAFADMKAIISTWYDSQKLASFPSATPVGR